MKKCIITSMLLFFLLLISASPNLLYAQPVQNLANGHWYQLITLGGPLTWEQARDYAAGLSYNGLPGHLATVTSSDENGYIADLISSAGSIDIWIGGYQLSGQTQPDVGWRWVTGEPWSFTNWRVQSNEPNDWPTAGENSEQNYLEIYYTDNDAYWYDEGSTVTLRYILVEYEPAAARVQSVPTMTEWGMIIFIVLAGLGSVYYLRRQRKA
jgi:Lectin C-type domain